MNSPWYAISLLAVFLIAIIFTPWWAALALALLWYPSMVAGAAVLACTLYAVDWAFEWVMSWTR